MLRYLLIRHQHRQCSISNYSFSGQPSKTLFSNIWIVWCQSHLCTCGTFQKSDMTCSNVRATCHDTVKGTGEEVVDALRRADTSDLKSSFRRALSYSAPRLALYRNYRPVRDLNLIFGVPLEDHEVNEDKVPKLMRMCIEEVEKRGLNINKIYSVSLLQCRDTFSASH